MENNKNKLIGLKKELTGLVFGATCLLSLTGCAEVEQNNIEGDYTIYVSNDIDNTYKEYSKVLNIDGIDNEELLDYFENKQINISLLSVEDQITYTNNKIDSLKELNTKYLSNKTFKKYGINKYIIWPSILGSDTSSFALLNINCKKVICIQNLSKLDSKDDYKYITCYIKFNKDLPLNLGLDENIIINKNDFIKSETLLYNNEVIAYKQTGLGSNSDNVIEVGDINIALSNPEELGLDSNIIENNNQFCLEHIINAKYKYGKKSGE